MAMYMNNAGTMTEAVRGGYYFAYVYLRRGE